MFNPLRLLFTSLSSWVFARAINWSHRSCLVELSRLVHWMQPHAVQRFVCKRVSHRVILILALSSIFSILGYWRSFLKFSVDLSLIKDLERLAHETLRLVLSNMSLRVILNLRIEIKLWLTTELSHRFWHQPHIKLILFDLTNLLHHVFPLLLLQQFENPLVLNSFEIKLLWTFVSTIPLRPLRWAIHLSWFVIAEVDFSSGLI